MLWWTDDLKTGIFTIDEQHKEIFREATKIFELGEDGNMEEMRHIFSFLMDYATNHFREEEILMDEKDYCKLDKHREEHNYFIDELHYLYKNMEDNGLNTENLNRLQVLMIDWLANHISHSDKDFIKRMND